MDGGTRRWTRSKPRRSKADRRAKQEAKAKARAEAVAKFRESYDPSWATYPPRGGSVVGSDEVPEDEPWIMYQLDGHAMMHNMGDYKRMLKFQNEQDCLDKLREHLSSPGMGAVVVWEYREIYFKKPVPRTYVEAMVHEAEGCSTFWVHTKENKGTVVFDAPLKDIVGLATSIHKRR